ncbi:hypothetical protein KC19_7G144500 [Ceratodon purpureus]|uniref:Uncharacterized protein n=1 Tax=Ceratodon purpureus TaxID=3225 RepID=A0A8T0H6I9_CERPU|nr:hypothetical protein KC19_7G144500 [Ceratodon purpureus]
MDSWCPCQVVHIILFNKLERMAVKKVHDNSTQISTKRLSYSSHLCTLCANFCISQDLTSLHSAAVFTITIRAFLFCLEPQIQFCTNLKQTSPPTAYCEKTNSFPTSITLYLLHSTRDLIRYPTHRGLSPFQRSPMQH